MPDSSPQDDQAIIAAAYAQRVHDLFKIFAESVYTGEPERDAVVRFRRGLISARRVYELALTVMQEGGPG
jgi:hypothetical protein